MSATGICAAVDAMPAQDYPDLEVILVNDCSTNRTAGIMAVRGQATKAA